jgi:hypothetical protein
MTSSIKKQRTKGIDVISGIKITISSSLILIFNTNSQSRTAPRKKISQEGPSYHVPHLSCLLQSCNLHINKRKKKISSWTE